MLRIGDALVLLVGLVRSVCFDTLLWCTIIIVAPAVLQKLSSPAVDGAFGAMGPGGAFGAEDAARAMTLLTDLATQS